jgi:hypothetical protein
VAATAQPQNRTINIYTTPQTDVRSLPAPTFGVAPASLVSPTALAARSVTAQGAALARGGGGVLAPRRIATAAAAGGTVVIPIPQAAFIDARSPAFHEFLGDAMKAARLRGVVEFAQEAA